MPKPNPIIEMAVLIHAIRVLSPAILVRWRARSVRSSARTVPLSFAGVSIRLMGPSLGDVFLEESEMAFGHPGLLFIARSKNSRRRRDHEVSYRNVTPADVVA